MTATAKSLQPDAEPAQPLKLSTRSRTFSRVAKYASARMVMLFVTVIIGVYLTILIANMGGYVDQIRRGQIREQIGLRVQSDPNLRDLPQGQRREMIEQLVMQEERRVGLDQPFIVSSFTYPKNSLTLNLGRAEYLTSDTGSKQVRLILLERLVPTLALWGAANILLFFSSIFFALFLSRRYGSLPDRLVVALSPTSSAPGWFYGLFLILVFASVLGILPFGGMVDAPPPEGKIPYALNVLKHLILPTTAILISSVFLNTYNWRTFFLIYSSEDYVEMAKAKGLSSQEIERRYVLRPTLPTIITSLALLLIGLWTGAIILETVFNWPGLGKTIYRAIGAFDTPVIVGSTMIFAYLLAITVFVLDFIYALVDPRVKLGGGGKRA